LTERAAACIASGKLEEVNRQVLRLLFAFLPGRSSQGKHHMTISAENRAESSDALERAFGLYRDLSEALSGRIAQLKAGIDGKDGEKALKEHARSLNTVLDIEVDLGRRWKAWGGGVELDLDAARAEVLARLAGWPEG
jgi:hypothetical protein